MSLQERLCHLGSRHLFQLSLIEKRELGAPLDLVLATMGSIWLHVPIEKPLIRTEMKESQLWGTKDGESRGEDYFPS